MVERFRRNWADMIGYTEKISTGQKFTDILTFAVTLTLNAVINFFPSDFNIPPIPVFLLQDGLKKKPNNSGTIKYHKDTL